MHVSNRVAYHLSEEFFNALQSVDVVGLETNPGDWMDNMEKTGELKQETVFSNSYLQQRDFYGSVFDAKLPDKKLLQNLISYDPDLINGLLYRRNGGKENFEENTYIDLFIFQAASKLGKKVISLEDFIQAEIHSRLASLPDDETEEEYGSRNNIFIPFSKIEDAYRTGNLDLLDSLSKKGNSKNNQTYLINRRNVFFVNTIDSVLQKNTIFSGVGAAHLPGEEGVIELLRKKGYTLEPVFPKNNSKADKTRDEIEAMRKPVTFVKQLVTDSVFSVAVPGKLYSVVDLENIKYKVFADMVNGSFYSVVRLKYSGPLFNMNASAMQAKMDSLLFENIPGKIISKKEITSNNGFKGIEVINKTRTGDMQHYQFFFTDFDITLFKMGGKGDYAIGPDATSFFSSIHFHPKKEEKILFTPKTKGFEVQIPKNHSYLKNSGVSSVGLVEDVHAYAKANSTYFGIKHAVYNDFDYIEEDTFELNILSSKVLKSYEFEENIKKELIKHQNLPAIQFSGQHKNGKILNGKIIIKGVHYYLFFTVNELNTQMDQSFFESIKLTPIVSTEIIKEIEDKDFYFKATDEVSDNASTRFNELYRQVYEKEMGHLKKKKEKKKDIYDYDYRTERKAYYSPSSNEYVNIVYEKFNNYDYKSNDEFVELLEKNLKGLHSIYPSNTIKKYHDGGIFTYRTNLKDTASSRAIAFKMLIKNGMRYEVSTTYDTIIGLEGWSKGFFESFRLTDTVIGLDIIRIKFDLLVNDLLSSDTIKRREANHSVQRSINMHKFFALGFIELLSNPRFNEINEDSRAQLLVNGGTLETEKIIEPYKKLYQQYTDSFYLQLSLLKGLAYLKTQKSYDAFYELLRNDAPLVGQESIISDVFQVLNDSLELCKKFFPSMLTLTRYEEYRNPVYSLLAQLIEKELVNPKVISARKDDILADAHLTQKRYNPGVKNIPGNIKAFENLDKASREIAEVLALNLEGLANNSIFQNTSFLKNLDAVSRHELVNYAVILMPFYKSDERIRQYFNRLDKIKSQHINMPIVILKHENKIQGTDTLFNYYCTNLATRAYFYSELEKRKIDYKFLKRYKNQESLNQAVISIQLQFAKIYSYDKDKKQIDSLYPIENIPAINRYQKGKLYFYKIGKERGEKEKWAIAFVQNSDKELTVDVDVISLNFIPDKTKTQTENMQQAASEFALRFRKRVSQKANDLSYSSY